MRGLKPLVALVVCGPLLAACSESTGPVSWRASTDLTVPPGRGGHHLHVLEQRASAPPLATYEASFHACRDRSQTLHIRYLANSPNDRRDAGGESDHGADPGSSQSDERGGDKQEFLSLRVPQRSLLAWPDGTPFAAGECVEITVSVDPHLFVVEFLPAGLKFDPSRPAELRYHYANADPDYNDDGMVDDRDNEIEALHLGVWRVPHGDEPWHRIESIHDRQLKRFRAQLTRFSHYLVAH